MSSPCVETHDWNDLVVVHHHIPEGSNHDAEMHSGIQIFAQSQIRELLFLVESYFLYTGGTVVAHLQIEAVVLLDKEGLM